MFSFNHFMFAGPLKRTSIPDTSKLSEGVGNTRSVLRSILIQSRRQGIAHHVSARKEYKSHCLSLYDNILEQCHSTFTACFHAFYPTGQLKWTCLCDLLDIIQPVSTSNLTLFCTVFFTAFSSFTVALFSTWAKIFLRAV